MADVVMTLVTVAKTQFYLFVGVVDVAVAIASSCGSAVDTVVSRPHDTVVHQQ